MIGEEIARLEGGVGEADAWAGTRLRVLAVRARWRGYPSADAQRLLSRSHTLSRSRCVPAGQWCNCSRSRSRGCGLSSACYKGFCSFRKCWPLALGSSAAVPPTLQGVLITHPGASRCSADSGRGTGVEMLTHCEGRLL